MLTGDLDIINTDHCSKIMSAIIRLFPNSEKKSNVALQSSRFIETTYDSVCCEEKISESVYMPFTQIYEDTNSRCRQCSSWEEKIDSESSLMESVQSEEDSISRCRQLILTLNPEQRIQGNQIDYLRNRFAEFSYDVNVRRSSIKSDSYVVVFQDKGKAKKARLEAETIGYKLAKKRGQRPSPTCMV